MFHLPKLAATALVAASLLVSTASAQTVLRSSDTHPDGYPTVEAVKAFGELLSEKTDGRYSVEVFHSAQLGEEKDTIEQTQFGVIDLNRISIGAFGTQVPEVLVISKVIWDGLTPEDQALFREAAKESVAKQREFWAAKEVASKAAVEALGATINEVDKQPFIDAMGPVYEKYVTDAALKDLVARIQATEG